MICFLFPHPYADPPEGQYCTLDVEEGSGWNNVILGGDVQDPYKTLELIRAVNPTVVVPHSEESVLCAGVANTALGLPGVSLETAIACTDRVTQRQLLCDVHFGLLNPQWAPLVAGEDVTSHISYNSLVVKTSVSTLSRGVQFASVGDNLHYIEHRLRRRCYELVAKLERVTGVRSCGLVEEYIDAPSLEVSGVVGENGRIEHLFRPLGQTWEDNRIMKYHPGVTVDSDLHSYTREIVKAFSMQNCGFSIEFKGPPWKVIEVHCRLGEDGGNYEELFSPKKPSAQWLYDIIA